MSNLKQNLLLKFINFYPPFLGAGIRVKRLEGPKYLVSMKLRFYNKNYVGVHFGGSLNMMCDPFFMLILMEKLGPDYLVWDKASNIQFKAPGKGKVSVLFHITEKEVSKIIKDCDEHGKTEPEFTVEITNEEGQVVSVVHKTLWVKKKTKAL